MSTQNQTCVIRQGRLAFHCPACNNPMSARIDEAGQRYTCAKCETEATIPAPPSTPPGPRPDDPLIQGEDKIAALRRSLKADRTREEEDEARAADRAERSNRLSKSADKLHRAAGTLTLFGVLCVLGAVGWVLIAAAAEAPILLTGAVAAVISAVLVLTLRDLAKAVATHLDVTAEELADA